MKIGATLAIIVATLITLGMGNYAEAQQTQAGIQSQINANITNNQKQLITGPVLNSVLTNMNTAIFQPFFPGPIQVGSLGIGKSPSLWIDVAWPNSTAQYEVGEVPWLANIIAGQKANPITNANPLFGISRREAITTDTEGGQNTALTLESVGNNTSTWGSIVAQVNTFTAHAKQIGTGDAVAAYLTVDQAGGTSSGHGYVGYALFASLNAATAHSGIMAYSTNMANNTGTDQTLATNQFGSTQGVSVGIDMVAAGSNLVGVAYWTRANAQMFDAAYVTLPGSVKTNDFISQSSAVTAFADAGSHSYGLNLSAAIYSVAAIRLSSNQGISWSDASAAANIGINFGLGSTIYRMASDGRVQISSQSGFVDFNSNGLSNVATIGVTGQASFGGSIYTGTSKGVTCSGALTAISSITITNGLITAATGTGGTCS